MMPSSNDKAIKRGYDAGAPSSSDPMDLGFSPKLRRLELSTLTMPTRRNQRLKASPSPAPDTPETSFRPDQRLEPCRSCISKPSNKPTRLNLAGCDQLHGSPHIATSEQQIRAARPLVRLHPPLQDPLRTPRLIRPVELARASTSTRPPTQRRPARPLARPWFFPCEPQPALALDPRHTQQHCRPCPLSLLHAHPWPRPPPSTHHLARPRLAARRGHREPPRHPRHWIRTSMHRNRPPTHSSSFMPAPQQRQQAQHGTDRARSTAIRPRTAPYTAATPTPHRRTTRPRNSPPERRP
ncbi:hypothetical protein D1007_36040 [Hordeum vulgare]|nr:hypothetical protein D1007_36040 [Hordeum vulgare]